MINKYNNKSLSQAGRREFLKRTAATSALGVAGPMALQLSAVSNAVAATGDDYKALVCVFLYGGNDHFNTVVPYDVAQHAIYEQTRGSIGTPRAQLAASRLLPTVPLAGDYEYALAPQMPNLLQMWNQGRAGIQLNVGTLMEPTTAAQQRNGSVEIPPNIFAHNLQQDFWQRLEAAGANSGWGGRLVDRIMSEEQASPFSSMSIFGNTVMMTGQTTMATNVTATGSSLLRARSKNLFGSAQVSQAAEKLMTSQSDHLFMEAHASLVRRSLQANDILEDAFSRVTALNTQFTTEEEPLSLQLKRVAELISIRSELGVKRQIFFVGQGGYDTHSNSNNVHPVLLGNLDSALQQFYDATVELGVSDKVTTFTGSDFGRSLTNNGDGSDHGWGGHQIIMGDAVAGGRFYGTPADISNGAEQMMNSKRLVPTTSIEQVGSSLGRWFGVSDGDLADVFPRLDRFDPTDLGYFG